MPDKAKGIMNLKTNYISNASAQSLGRVCTMGANFVVFIMAARMLGSEVFGQYSYITVFLGLAILMAEFGTTSILAVDISQVGANASAYWGNFLVLRLLISLLVSAIAIPVAWLVRPELFPSLLVGLLGLFFLGSWFFHPIFQVYERPWFSFWGSVVYSLVLMLPSVAALLLKRSVFELILIYVLANVVYAVFSTWQSLLVIRPSFRLQWSIQKSILALAVPVGISSILTLIHTRADTFMLAMMKGDYAVGIYNGAYRFLDMATIAAVMLSTPLVPIFSKLVLDNKEKLRSLYARILEALTGIIVPIALIVPLISTLFVELLFGPEYWEVAPLLNIMAWIGVLTFFSLFNFAILLAVKVVRFQIWLGALTAILNVGLNFLLIPNFGFYGSAWATLLVECVFVLVSFLYIVKAVGNIFDFSTWRRIAVVCLATLAVVHVPLDIDLPWRLTMAVAAWWGAMTVLKNPFWKTLRR